jgi:MFS family permease
MNDWKRYRSTKLTPATMVSAFGLIFFIGMMAIGYFYNLTFVQLGLIDLGERILGLNRQDVSNYLALLALLTSSVAIGFGWLFNRHGWGKDLILRLRIAFLVILIQTVLTFAAGWIQSETAYLLWLVICSLTLGIGVPITFSMTVDFVPRGWRGEAAALITALAYLAANLIPASWRVEDLADPFYWVMPVGLVGFIGLMFFPKSWIKILAGQHKLSQHFYGRYSSLQLRDNRLPQRILGFVALMFVVFFIDSLGFLRLLETPRFMLGAWQSPYLQDRLVIGIVHVIGALVGGVLYDALDVRNLFYWIFGIFALVHLMYSFALRFESNTAPLSMPVLYALAVSLYTVVNFAIWADLSTPETIGLNSAIGVAFSGWTATFLSTALAIGWERAGMPLTRHINIVDSIAMLALVALIMLAYFSYGRRKI